MSHELGAILVSRKSGTERFHRISEPLGFDVLSFWQWSASDLLSNATRGILAEYLVARAIGAAERVRAEWDSFDLVTDGVRVEVKSAAYLQSWHQEKLSTIIFGVQPTLGWDAVTNITSEERKRQADIYVFCLLAHKEKATVDPLDVAQWRFLVVPTERLNRDLRDQKTVGLARLREMGVREMDYSDLANAIRRSVQG